MPAVMRVLGWRAEGLRCPDHDIDCSNDSGQPHAISLIQMPNGTGKTTTLSLLRAALSGAAGDWDRAKIQGFRKRTNSDDSGSFEVRLLLNGKRVTIIMTFDFASGRVYYKTTRAQGQVDGFSPPVDFRRFLNANFANFFVFDGELAEHLLDKKYTDAEAVVESLFQINAFSDLERRVEEYWVRKTQKSATEDKGFTRRANRVTALRNLLKAAEVERAKLLEKQSEIVSLLGHQKKTYDQAIKKEEARGAAVTKAEIQLKDLQAAVREYSLDVLETMRDPQALSITFGSALHDLKTALDRVKLPESAAREFFEELALEAECVCGREINDEVRAEIRNRASKYLGSDDVSLLNSMKTAIHDAVGLSIDQPVEALESKMGALEDAVKQAHESGQELDELRHEAEQSDPAARAASDEIKKLDAEMSRIEQDLAKFDSRDEGPGIPDEKTFGIDSLKARLEDAETNLEEIKVTIGLRKKRNILVGIIHDAHEKARNGILREICVEANQRIAQVMPNNNISISGIDGSLVLDGQEGGSVGETLSVAYAFLSTLFERSEHQLPFLVDSPANPIDLAVRPKIGDLIPRLTGQFIAFTISSERDRFVQPIQRASKAPIHFITLFRKGPTELEDAARKSHDCSETADGIVVRGESFFNAFQLNSQEAP